VKARYSSLNQILFGLWGFWSVLQGKHAYHNYTIRRLYRCFSQKPFVSRQVYDKRCIDLADDPIIEAYPQVPADGELVNLEADMLDEDEEPSDDVAMLLTHELADDMLNTFAEDCKGEFQKPSESTNATLGTDVTGRRAWWLPTPDEADKVVSSHFRSVISCTCAMPEIFRDARFIRISITGNSFMVHQVSVLCHLMSSIFFLSCVKIFFSPIWFHPLFLDKVYGL
jgi:tRNA pseudouridine38-40 synthase